MTRYDKGNAQAYQLQIIAEWLGTFNATLTAYDETGYLWIDTVCQGSMRRIELPMLSGAWSPAMYAGLKPITEQYLKDVGLWDREFIWRIHQVGEGRELALMILEKGLALLQHMPRTGKTGTAMYALHLVSVHINKDLNILISTTTNGMRGRAYKKGMKPEGWQGFIEATTGAGFCTRVHCVITTPYRLHKIDDFLPVGMEAPSAGKWDVVLVDESHKIFSACDIKDTATYSHMRMLCIGAAVVLITATPHAQSLNQIYRQFGLSGNSPFFSVGYYHHRPLKDFKAFFDIYGEPKTTIVGGGTAIPVYTESRVNPNTGAEDGEEPYYIDDVIEPYRLILTQQDAGISEGMLPVDKKVIVPLSDREKVWYDALMVKDALEVDGVMVVPTSDGHARIMAHQIEGGTLKFVDEFSVRDPDTGLKMRGTKAPVYKWEIGGIPSKVQWIWDTFGDVESLVIMYHYVEEGKMLRKYFKKATVLQGKTNSEAIDLWMYDNMVIYSMDWSVATYIQRRDRQVHMTKRDKPITIYYPCMKGGISEDVYDVVVSGGQDLTFDYYKHKTRSCEL